MKNSKYISILASSTLLINYLSPLPVQAKEQADIWPYEKSYDKYFNLESLRGYNGGITQLKSNFSSDIAINLDNLSFSNDPEKLKKIESVAPAYLHSKSIKNVSFIGMENLKIIGNSYVITREKYFVPGGIDYRNALTSNFNQTFSDNEIRRIYWDSDNKYNNEISISGDAFKNNKIQFLDLPNKIYSIGPGSFYNNNITWIKGWENVRKLEYRAFYNNELVSSLPDGYTFTLPKKITKIEFEAFKKNKLTHLAIPTNIIEIEDHAFSDNPITSVVFDSPTTKIKDDIFYSSNSDGTYENKNKDIIVYGHGETSTARTFAMNNGYKYVDLEYYQNTVLEAEESKTKEKIDIAKESVSDMQDGEVKDELLKRISEVENSFEIDDLVKEAERTLNKEDYMTAKYKVDELESETLRTPYQTRLERVLLAINNAKMAQFKDFLDSNTGSLTLGKLNELKDELEQIGGLDAEDLINKLNQTKKEAGINTYKKAYAYVKFAEQNKNFANVAEAQKLINELDEDFSITEEQTLTYTDKYLKDSNGNDIIDEEASYQKETLEKTDEFGNIFSEEVFKEDANGNRILKDGLDSPIYKEDPLYGTNYVVTVEKGNKEYLQSILSEFDDEIYAEYAVKIADKHLTQEKIDDALILTLVLEASPKKETLLNKIEDLQYKLNELTPVFEEINKKINRYGKTELLEDYNEALEYINTHLSTDKLKEQYSDKLNLVKYKSKLEFLLKEAKEFGLTESTQKNAILYLSFLKNSDFYEKLYNDFSPLNKEFLEYQDTYLDLIKEFNNLDVSNPDLFSIEDYLKMKEKIFIIKDNNPYKEELISELNYLYESFIASKNGEYEFELLSDQIKSLKSNFKKTSIIELANLKEKISAVKNKNYRTKLKDLFDDLDKTIVEDYLIPEYKKPSNFTPHFKEDILAFITLINNESMKLNLNQQISQEAHDIIVGDILINMKGPDVIRDTVVEGYQVNLEDMISMIGDNIMQDDVLKIVDDKIIKTINDNYLDAASGENGESTGGEAIKELDTEKMKLLADMYAALSDLSNKEQTGNVVQNVLNNYVITNYNTYIQEGDASIKNFYDMSSTMNYFDGIHLETNNFQTIKNDIEQTITENFYKTINNTDINKFIEDNSVRIDIDASKYTDNSSYTDNRNQFSYISQAIENIGAIINTDVKATMYNDMRDYLYKQFQSIDMSKSNILTNLTDLGETMNSVSAGGNGQTYDSLMGDIYNNYIIDNSQTIWDIATQNNNQTQAMKFLSTYLSQDEIHKLTINDQDNVIGIQNNDTDYYKQVINSMGDDMNELFEVLDNLQDIIDSLREETGHVLQDSSINTIGNNHASSGNYVSSEGTGLNQFSGWSNFGGFTGDILTEIGINEQFNDNYDLINRLKREIEKMQKENKDLIGENIIALKAAALKNDKALNKKLENYGDANKTYNNILIGLGSSMWLLILLGLMYNANMNLRNKKQLSEIDDSSLERKEEIEQLEKEIEHIHSNAEKKLQEIKDLLNKK